MVVSVGSDSDTNASFATTINWSSDHLIAFFDPHPVLCCATTKLLPRLAYLARVSKLQTVVCSLNTLGKTAMQSAIAYYRVSTQRQGRSGLGLEAQRAAVTRFAELMGLQIF